MSGLRRFFVGNLLAASLFALRMLLLAVGLLLARFYGVAHRAAA